MLLIKERKASNIAVTGWGLSCSCVEYTYPLNLLVPHPRSVSLRYSFVRTLAPIALRFCSGLIQNELRGAQHHCKDTSPGPQIAYCGISNLPYRWGPTRKVVGDEIGPHFC